MQYVLGNMLNGAGGLNPDGLSLDLQFAADKTFSKPSSLAAGETAITSRRGPSATFLRSSAATEVGPDGLIRYAPENLVIGSSAAAFSAANATRGTSTILGIDGVALTSCTSLNANGNRVSSSLITIAPNQIYTLSAYMAAGTSSFGGLVADNFPTGVGAIFNLTGSGSVVSSAVASGTVISTSIQRIGTTELYRCSITFSFTSITSAAVGFGVSNGSTYAFSIFPSASSGTVNAGAIQLQRSSTARTYIPTTTAEVYAPRFDHDPATFASKGLLIEEGRTNAFQHSSNFKNTTSSNYWSNETATTITVDQIASPDGGVNADLLSTSTSSFDCFTRRNNFWAGSTQYTYSIFVKRGPSNYRYVGLYIGAGASATQFPYFDFDNPTTVQIPTITSGTINSTRVDAYPNGWYRVIITFTTAATPITLFGGVYISASNGVLQEGNTAGNNCYIWGIQSELGSFPTSYIPTTTGTLARSADVCSITGGNFTSFYNQSEGTLFLNAVPPFESQLAYPLMVNTTANSQAHRIARTNEVGVGSKRWRALTTTSAGLEAVITTSGNITTTNVKAAYAFKLNDNAFAVNNVLVGTDTTVTMPNPTSMRIGGNDGVDVLNGHIAAVRFYKKRLPDAKLQALTA
jgi:hypothetical protein